MGVGAEPEVGAEVGVGAEPSIETARRQLRQMGEWAQPVTLAADQVLPVTVGLVPLFPDGGLRRGTVVSTGAGIGAVSLALAAVAEASVAGSWLAVVGGRGLGLAAADELGVALDRLVVIERPEPAQWGAVVAALVDAFELVLVAPGHRVKVSVARRLAARARERGAVLVHVGRWAWPEAPDLRLDSVEVTWQGLGAGHGTLRARRVVVTGVARRDAVARRRVELWLPDADGHVRLVDHRVDHRVDHLVDQDSALAEVHPLRPAV